jgi:GMP synthase-like glutamine amidotransferase
MPAALVLQTEEDCPAGRLGDWARSRGIVLDAIRVDRWGELPDPADYDFAVALDSATSLTESRAGWVDAELEWIRRAEAAAVPVLGICFGAQALAVALGGAVTRLPTPEFGWIEIQTADDARVPRGPWLALHEDAISPPPLSYELARNHVGVQAFSVGRHLGVQFHPEASPALIARWMRRRHDAGTDARTSLLRRARELDGVAAAAAAALFDGFATGAGVGRRDALASGGRP